MFSQSGQPFTNQIKISLSGMSFASPIPPMRQTDRSVNSMLPVKKHELGFRIWYCVVKLLIVLFCNNHLVIGIYYLQVTLSGQISSMQTIVDRLYMGCEFIDKLIRYAPATEALSFKKQINSRIQELLAFQPDNTNSVSGSDLEFVSNYQVFCVLYPPT